MFCVEIPYFKVFAEFKTYREAEIFCIDKGIPCEDIYEVDDDDL
jgi:hypothetical protein